MNRISSSDDENNEILNEIKEFKLPNIFKNSILLNIKNENESLKQLARKVVLRLLIENKIKIIEDMCDSEENYDEVKIDDLGLAEIKDEEEEYEDDEENSEDDDDEEKRPQKHKSINDMINLKCQNSFEEFIKTKNRNFSKLNGLWLFQDANVDAIRDWNLKQSCNYPHCSICLLFKFKPSLYLSNDEEASFLLEAQSSSSISSTSSDMVKSHSELCISTIINENENKLKLKILKSASSYVVKPKQVISKTLPKNSEVLIPEMCFTKHSKTRSKLPDFQRDKIDCLLQCKNCNLTVHQSKSLCSYSV